MLGISQHQKQTQKLTPQMFQYYRILQLPQHILEMRIKTELEQNPMLEIEEELELEAETEEKQDEELEMELEQEEPPKEDKTDDELSIEDLTNDDLGGHKTPDDRDNDDRGDNIQAATTSLIENLTEQLHMLDLDEEEMFLADEILGNIDEDGYLRRSLEEILNDVNSIHKINLSFEQASRVLQKIQTLDPPGIGSRTIEECLLVQILVMEDHDPSVKANAERIIREYFDLFKKKHYEEISKKSDINLEDLEKAVILIQKLNIKPGEGQFTSTENTIIPDFIVTSDDGEIVISLNDGNVPPLRLNKTYQSLLSRKTDKETKDFARKNYEAAKWFLSAIYQRRDTMMRVMRAIVEKQREFFLEGETNLKPIIYKDIADIVKLDISTISRTVRGKYVQTDYGTFELKYFFSEKLESQSGEEVSNKQVMMLIKDIISEENKKKPLTDEEIVTILKERNFTIARRTVAKYREGMNIPVARMRKNVF
jgi:RNA polymerase sigma-54 factor